MRQVAAAFLLALGVGAWVGPGAMAAGPQQTGAAVTAQADLHATVESVDMTTRQVLLRDESGKLETVTVGPEARNLGQVRPGDHVTVRLVMTALAEMAPAGGAGPDVAKADYVDRTPKGAMPGGVVGDAVRVRVTFNSYDPGTKTVTYTLPSGAQVIEPVRRPAMQSFASGLKAGDKVDLTFIRAIGISVTPMK
jgi:hypothetical protein